MDACGNRSAITRSRPQAYYYYALKKGERTGTPKPYFPPRCVNHVPGLFCKRSPRLLSCLGRGEALEYRGQYLLQMVVLAEC
jgi:hypothetical protein